MKLLYVLNRPGSPPVEITLSMETGKSVGVMYIHKDGELYATLNPNSGPACLETTITGFGGHNVVARVDMSDYIPKCLLLVDNWDVRKDRMVRRAPEECEARRAAIRRKATAGGVAASLSIVGLYSQAIYFFSSFLHASRSSSYGHLIVILCDSSSLDHPTRRTNLSGGESSEDVKEERKSWQNHSGSDNSSIQRSSSTRIEEIPIEVDYTPSLHLRNLPPSLPIPIFEVAMLSASFLFFFSFFFFRFSVSSLLCWKAFVIQMLLIVPIIRSHNPHS